MTRAAIEASLEAVELRAGLAVESEMRRVAEEWQRTHPRRRVRFTYGGGWGARWIVDGKTIPSAWEISREALGRVFEPLLEALDWYTGVHEDRRLCSAEFELEPK